MAKSAPPVVGSLHLKSNGFLRLLLETHCLEIDFSLTQYSTINHTLLSVQSIKDKQIDIMSKFDNHTFLCTICARGGSKGVPGKNIRTLIDRPLIAYTIEQAKDAGIFAAVAVSSDSDAILDTARSYGADIIIKRPSELASDTAGKIPAIVHALEAAETELGLKVDYHFDLDATSPLRIPQDILACADILLETSAHNVITGTPAHRSPYFNLVEQSKDGKIFLSKTPEADVLRRQDSPDCFDMNGSIYGWKREVLREEPKLFYADTQLYVMPRNRSVDIDEELDFALVTLLMQQRLQQEERQSKETPIGLA